MSAKPEALACMFHEGGGVSHVFAKRIDLPGGFLGVVALGQFVPVQIQQHMLLLLLRLAIANFDQGLDLDLPF
jgi:hypothetical protein